MQKQITIGAVQVNRLLRQEEIILDQIPSIWPIMKLLEDASIYITAYKSF